MIGLYAETAGTHFDYDDGFSHMGGYLIRTVQRLPMLAEAGEINADNWKINVVNHKPGLDIN